MAKSRPRKKSRSVAPRRPKPRTRQADARSETEMALAALAHEIRTPLTGILAFAELLAGSGLKSTERSWAEGIKGAAEHLTQLTTIVCDAVRAGHRGLALRDDAFAPRELAQSVAQALEVRAKTNGLTARIEIADNLPETAKGDQVRLRAALENLIDNAVKFTARGEVGFLVAARPAARARTRLSFTVTDSGAGMTPAELKKLFRPFAQASADVARQYGGSGLGLTMVKRLARAMGGDLTVRSKKGSGSRFTLDVIVGPVSLPVAQHHEQRAALPTPARQRRRILCVEDNPYGRVMLKTLLNELGHTAEYVGHGEAALALLASRNFDVVLMDVTLPGMDGFEATRRIRKLAGRAASIPVIGVSANTDPRAEAQALEAGMNAYLTKPVSPNALAQAIAQCLGQKAA